MESNPLHPVVLASPGPGSTTTVVPAVTSDPKCSPKAQWPKSGTPGHLAAKIRYGLDTITKTHLVSAVGSRGSVYYLFFAAE